MAETPMMQQYKAIKRQHADAILFFRLGDFYEMFFDDAITASKTLEITLTSRDSENKIPMCGVPYHAVDAYIAKMVAKGYKVALCDQIGDPKATKGIVKREVTRVITPGTVMESQLLQEKNNNYIASIFFDSDGTGLAYADISTGEFMVSEIDSQSAITDLISELERLQVSELLLPVAFKDDEMLVNQLYQRITKAITFYHNGAYEIDEALKYLQQQFPDQANEINWQRQPKCLAAAGALVQFLLETQRRSLNHIIQLKYYSISQFMALDMNARRNLELTRTIMDGNKKGSLLWVLDHTTTAMGGRLLKKWIEQPLLDINQINARLDAVSQLSAGIFLREDLRVLLKQVYDLERLTAKVVYGSANARDLLALKNSLFHIPDIKKLLLECTAPLLKEIANQMDTLTDLVTLLTESINDDPPISLRDGGLINNGYNEQVDKLKEASTNGRNWLAQLETRERERTGIKSLKIRYNKVFGYYIEVTKSNLDMVPEDYQRKQTLANAERYITSELKKYEDLILGAQEKLIELEYRIFIEIRDMVAKEIARIQKTAGAVAKIDVLISLAEVAVKHNYVRPTINDSGKLTISAGRHPVVETMLNQTQFVPNDTQLDTGGSYLALITGPNMGGKSTYQRQVALITLMAQIGSFVPAASAEIGIVDRIFARVGAADDLASGHSTFMVEMQECNNALRGATTKSLVIIDELGRGTSNLEGMAIAQAVIEYLHNTIGCRTLFSTHYHELAELESSLPGLKNYAAAVEEKGDNVAFLHRIVLGKASKSYGVHCAMLAGLPDMIINRANQLSTDYQRYLKAAEEVVSTSGQTAVALEPNAQLQLFNDASNNEQQEILSAITDIDLLNTTPLGAIQLLFELQNKIKNLYR
ncbi:DNA mismatch repair protein MutS [Peptococcaceae bacterium 1198_IL3148]